MIRVLAISGSLRKSSSNTALVRAAAALAPEAVDITVYEGLADLPHFNPDSDGETAPPPIADFRSRLEACDGVLISSPEYAHGVPGTLKNALDWIVSSGELMGKPVALINASPHAVHALASLAETLSVMMANVVAEASITVPIAGRKLDECGIVEDPDASVLLRSAILALARVIETRRAAPC